MGALSGLRIIEIAERVVGEYCGKLLADLGAEVIKVERPGGSPTRRLGPIVDTPDGSRSALFAYLGTNKKSVVIDVESDEGRSALARLIGGADALIDDHDEHWCVRHRLDKQGVRADNPAIVHCCITPFGQGAPADRQKAHPINIVNAGGWAWHSPSESDPSDPPLMGAGRFMPSYDAGLDAAMATAASLYRKRTTGKGQFIDLSEVEVQMSRADIVIGRVLAGDDEPTHGRGRYDMGGPGTSFACADGFVHIYMTTKKHWNGLRELMGWPDWAEEFPEDWLEFHCTPPRVAAFRDRFEPWIATQQKVPITDAAQKLGVPLAPVNDAADLLANAQYRHRGFFQSVEGDPLGDVEYPMAPYRLTASPVTLRSAAPRIGEHDGEYGR